MPSSRSPILIVDDEKDNLEALQRLLRNQFEVTVCISPVEALKLVQTTPFHVIVSDQRMPEMTGVELLEKVKKIRPSTTRVLLTGYTDIGSVIDAINRGNIYRYIAKPWDPDDLKITLNQADDAFKMRIELEEKNRQLLLALEDLKTLDKAKSRFLSLVSHELNTPLTVLNSFVELLSIEKSKLPADVQKYVQSIREASDRFGEIISEVLLYLKVTSESAVQKKEENVSAFLGSIREKVAKDLEKKKLKLKVKSDEGILHAVDSARFHILIERLIVDAILRSKSGTEILLEAFKKDGKLCLTLTRSGEAFDPAAFQPLEPSANIMHHQKNLGLNLATAKLVLDSHQGTVEMKSKSGLHTLEICIP